MRATWALISALLAAHASTAAAQPPEQPTHDDNKRAKIIAAASIGGIHLAYATWSYFAWYRDANTEDFHLEHTKWFRRDSYSGSADKVGHFWSNYALTRGTTAVLTAAGWKRLPSSLVAAGLTEVTFTLTEIQDGFVYGFDPKDIVANVAGAGLAVLMDNVPAVDRLFDFRLEYFPSGAFRYQFRKNGSVDVGQDYTGQSYILALHLGALPRMQHSEWTTWSKYIDFAVGFEAKHYFPEPEMRVEAPRQTLYFGLAFNMQGILHDLLPASTGRKIAHGAFEVYALPYTTLRYAEASRSP